jgi:hypothetical protein
VPCAQIGDDLHYAFARWDRVNHGSVPLSAITTTIWPADGIPGSS